MGYDLHITRARSWLESESWPITEGEWRALVASDPALEVTGVAEAGSGPVVRYENPGLARWRHPDGEEVWFDLRDGRVVVKNPDEPTIAKMIAVASQLGARVVGDEGEVYERAGVPARPATLSWRERVSSWFERLRPAQPLGHAQLPFGVGDRVRDSSGREAVVVAIDLQADHGMGRVEVRCDDGRELMFAAIAHGLTLVGRKNATPTEHE